MSEPSRAVDPELAHTAPIAEQSDRAETGSPVVDPEADAFPLAPGYELLEEVGCGGMGVVYRARDLALNREVAVKILHNRYAPNSTTATRFVEEARITARLQHPGIPAVYQVGTLTDGRPFLAMKLIKGQTLEDLLRDEGPGAIKWLGTFESICYAVGYAHARNVLHRDLKPANVMVGAFGEVQVMDWGLAKVLVPGERPQTASGTAGETQAVSEIRPPRDSDGLFTQAGSVLGTLAYMPPEQAAGQVELIDLRADVFGLGAILCALLTGKPPYEGVSVESIRVAAVRGKTEEAFRRLDTCGAESSVIALCKRCLSFEPVDRPDNADAVAKEIGHIRAAADERAQQAERDKLAAEVRTAEQRKRKRVIEWAAVAVIVALTAGVTGSLWQAKVAMREAYEAEMARREAEMAQQEAEKKRTEAELARQSELAQRKRAEAKQAEADAVLTFLDEKVFAATRRKSDGGLGADVTLRDAIILSLPELKSRFVNQPLVEARLRLTLALTFREAFDRDRAVEQGERAWTLYKTNFGPDHPNTIRSASELVWCYSYQGNRLREVQLLEEVLASRRRVLPANHRDTLKTLNQLALVYMILERHTEAVTLWEELLSAYRHTLAPGHADTVQVMYNLASSYSAAGRTKDQIQLLAEVVSLTRATHGEIHQYTVYSLGQLENAYEKAGRYDEALKAGHDALKAARTLYGPADMMTMSRILHHSGLLRKMNRGREAVPLLDEILAIPPAAKAKWLLFEFTLVQDALRLRLDVFRDLHDPIGCQDSAARAEALPGRHPPFLYNVAVLHALASQEFARANRPADATTEADKAMAWLKQAVAAGYGDRALLETDVDLGALRSRADFKQFSVSCPYIAPPPRSKPEK